jgi:hypothetical protein
MVDTRRTHRSKVPIELAAKAAREWLVPRTRSRGEGRGARWLLPRTVYVCVSTPQWDGGMNVCAERERARCVLMRGCMAPPPPPVHPQPLQQGGIGRETNSRTRPTRNLSSCSFLMYGDE